MKYKFEPVKWMTWTLAALVAISGVQEFVSILPEHVQAGILIAIAVLTALLGARVRKAVTPVAAPRDSAGRPLVALDNRSPGVSGYWPLENDSPGLSGTR